MKTRDNVNNIPAPKIAIPNIQGIIKKFLNYCNSELRSISNRRIPQYQNQKIGISYISTSANQLAKIIEATDFKKTAVPICAWLDSKSLTCDTKGFVCDFSSFSDLIFKSTLENYEKFNLIFYIILSNITGGILNVSRISKRSPFSRLKGLGMHFKNVPGFNNSIIRFKEQYFNDNSGRQIALYEGSDNYFDALEAYEIINDSISTYEDIFSIPEVKLENALRLLKVDESLINIIMEIIRIKNQPMKPQITSHQEEKINGTVPPVDYDNLKKRIAAQRRLRYLFSCYPDIKNVSTKENPKIYSINELIAIYQEAITLDIHEAKEIAPDGQEKGENLSHRFLEQCFICLSGEQKEAYINEVKKRYCSITGLSEDGIKVIDSKAFAVLVACTASTLFTKENDPEKVK